MLPFRSFKTGDRIPENGIYRVAHREHRLPYEVTLLKNQYFPRCSKCGQPVRFRLLQAIPEADAPTALGVKLYELPVFDESLHEAA